MEPYFRFSACDYNDENMLDKFIHLTNNSIAKYAEKVTITHEIEGNMMALEEVKAYLIEKFGWDVWEDKCKEQTKNIVINCLESV
jgi:methionyl-tRNA synthetase